MSKARIGWMLMLGSTLGACSSGLTEEEAEDLGATITVDLEWLFETIEATADAVANIEAGTTASDETCFSSIGDCEICSGYEGTASAGTFGVEANTPCGRTWEGLARTRSSTIESNDLDGQWTADDALTYVWSMTGDQGVTYTVTGGPLEERVYDASWTLSRFEATTVDGRLETYAIESTYDAYADAKSELVLAGTSRQATGTLTVEIADDTVVCDTERSNDTVTVRCD